MSQPFAKLGLCEWIQKVSKKMGYQIPTPIQQSSIPAILQKKNVIVNAETGSGKTATFAFPILQELSKDPYGIFALVLTPNRELAMQIQEQFMAFGSQLNLRCATIVGGMDISKQKSQLQTIPHIIVATPGRLVELFGQSSELKEYIENLQYLVIDEADRLFDDTILPDLRKIIDYLPKKKQVILATATINEKFNDQQISKFLKQELQFERFVQNDQKKIVKTLKQKYVFVPELVKDNYFVHLLQKKFPAAYCIVFVNKCRQCFFLNQLLKTLKLESVCINSYMQQGQRIASLKRFKNQQAQILIATDVASRGLDIPTVDLVINYDIPRKAEDYIHRAGRTARSGKRGLVLSILTQFDIDLVHNIEEEVGEKMELYEIKEEDVLENKNELMKIKKKVKLALAENGQTEEFDKKEERNKEYKRETQEKIKKIKLEME